MATGDKEIMLASEEVQRKNILTAVQFGNETRKMVLELGKIVDALQNQILVKSKQMDQLRLQLANLQQQFYAKGSTSYHTEDE